MRGRAATCTATPPIECGRSSPVLYCPHRNRRCTCGSSMTHRESSKARFPSTIRIRFQRSTESVSAMWASFQGISLIRSRRRSYRSGALISSGVFATISNAYVVKSTTTRRYAELVSSDVVLPVLPRASHRSLRREEAGVFVWRV